ncbi:hypothetical protein ACH5RR_023365 [Cinchona calisaya]|uniref:Uncharacterized protein n=1 Tax=Cinchona calisaya TaxID=153742 RepID=A0ABD2ZAI3_9GENT
MDECRLKATPMLPNHNPLKRKVVDKKDRVWRPKSDAVEVGASGLTTVEKSVVPTLGGDAEMAVEVSSSPGLSGIQHTRYKRKNNFTWTGVRQGRPIWKRLDRILMNQAWQDLFPESTVTYLNRRTSDHLPLLWSLGSWKEHGPRHSAFKICGLKLRHLNGRLKDWNKDVFGNVFHVIQRVEEEVSIKDINYELVKTEVAREELDAAQATCLLHIKNEELFIQEKASVKWLR